MQIQRQAKGLSSSELVERSARGGSTLSLTPRCAPGFLLPSHPMGIPPLPLLASPPPTSLLLLLSTILYLSCTFHPLNKPQCETKSAEFYIVNISGGLFLIFESQVSKTPHIPVSQITAQLRTSPFCVAFNRESWALTGQASVSALGKTAISSLHLFMT